MKEHQDGVLAASGPRWKRGPTLHAKRSCFCKDRNNTYISTSSLPLWSHGWAYLCPVQWPLPIPPAQSSLRPGVYLKPVFGGKRVMKVGAGTLQTSTSPYVTQMRGENGGRFLPALGWHTPIALCIHAIFYPENLKLGTSSEVRIRALTCLGAAPIEGLPEAHIQRPQPTWEFHWRRDARAEPAEPPSSWRHWSQLTPIERVGSPF